MMSDNPHTRLSKILLDYQAINNKVHWLEKAAKQLLTQLRTGVTPELKRKVDALQLETYNAKCEQSRLRLEIRELAIDMPVLMTPLPDRS